MPSKELFRKIQRIKIQTARLAEDVLAGAYRSVFKGRGMEFEEVRDYQAGDEIRSIDWKVTARMNRPYVKVFREERDLSVMLVVDVSASAHFGSGEHLKSDLIAEIAAVIAFSAIKNNDRIGLILFSDRVEKYLPPAKGVRHVLRIIRELLVFQPKHRKTDVSAALSFFGKVQARMGICFLISDFIASDYANEMSLIAKRHDLISIGIVDPYEKEFPKANLVRVRDLETGEHILVDTSAPNVQRHLQETTKQRLEKHSELIKKIGGDFIEIRTDKPYIIPLRKFFKQRERKKG